MDPVNEVGLLLHEVGGVAHPQLPINFIVEELSEQGEPLALGDALLELNTPHLDGGGLLADVADREDHLHDEHERGEKQLKLRHIPLHGL